LTFSFHGPREVVDARWTHVVRRYSSIPGIGFGDAPTYLFPMDAEEREAVIDKEVLGIPSLANFVERGIDGKPLDGHMDFSIVLPMTGEAVLEALKVMGRVFSASGVDVGLGAVTSFHPRTFTLISSFPTHRDDRDANRRMRTAYERAVEVAAEHGWGQYRTHAAFMDLALSSYSFNDHALAHFHSRLKDAVDPNGILSAGRYGIWPKHMRGSR
jgi:4-cresol dehydrogenase (hydroxylating)